MTTAEFIDELARQGALDDDLARQLRAKAVEGGHRVTPEAILKYLVKTDVITQWKGEELKAALLAAPAAAPDQDVLDLAPIDEELDDEPVGASRSRSAPIEMTDSPPGPAIPPAPPVASAPLFSSKAVRSSDSAFDDLPAGKTASGKASPAGMYKLGGGKKSNKKRTAGGRNQWDSPLLLLGGGALALLVVAAVLLYYLLFRENAAAVLADANNLFENGAYSQAIERYREFVTRFSNHEDASSARVQMEMTRLWQSVEGNSDPAESLALAQQVISEIEDEPAFISSGGESEQGLSSAKRDLSVLLVRIADALVKEADTETDQAKIEETIGQLQKVLQLSENSKYVPEKFRNAPALARVEEELGVIRTRQSRDSHLSATLEAMDKAISGGDVAAAYTARLALLAEYPALAGDEALAGKVREASAAEQARVKFTPADTAAETAWPARPVVAELALAARRGTTDAPATGEPIVVRIDGALYGLRSGDGALLWRRFAGQGETSAPLLVTGGGVVAAGLADGELWRLEAATGKLVWRLPLGDLVTGVIAAGERLLATSESGKLYVVDAASGKLAGSVEFSQPIRTAPAVNERGDRIYLAAEHSILYTLSAQDFACVGVYYSGHAAGAIAAPPVTILNKVIVADNSGTDTCRLRVLSVDGDGAIQDEVAGDRLGGMVMTPLATAARRIVAATSSGQVGVFEVGGANDQSALTVIARREGRDAQPLARFPLLHNGKLWLAADQLTKLTVLPTENQLSVESMDNDYRGDAFDAPLTAVGQIVIHVRRPARQPGVAVAATDAATNRTAWETEIAVPLAGAPAVDAARARVTAVTASGAAYALDREALARGVQDDALSPPSRGRGDAAVLTESLDLGGGALAVGAVGSSQLMLLRPDDPRLPVRSVQLAGPLTCGLVPWRGAVVCPTEVGQVFLVDPQSAAPAGTPFQPELTPDRKYRWLTPAVVGTGDQSQLALSDGAERLYLVKHVAEPTPHLEAAKSVDVGPSPLESPLAVVGERVIAGTEDGRLAAFSLPDLGQQDPVELGGRVAWGPFSAGDGALFATDAGELMMIGPSGAIAWRQELKHGDLVGQPLTANGSVLLLHASGGVSRINLNDGAEAGFAEIGQPAAAGPVALGERLLVAAPDGSLLIVSRP